MKIFDPTSRRTGPATLQLAPRPASLQGLRLGLVDNRKINAAAILEKVADRLAARHGTRVTVRDVKRSPSHEIDAKAIAALERDADLVISGVGD
jgi:alcohol dehydrogenase class IV